ncbi:hypothetical protein BD410DRAFT_780935 [Rickenella mellea]|uniref:Uncharacterized protein n=1 Tax=Rickenella mellea TaxID=50990 RepID=A0A4Y7QLE8_9AGAM|nr:hypothetical protein BD410DRAFT_780935 [Rickenella mellea]
MLTVSVINPREKREPKVMSPCTHEELSRAKDALEPFKQMIVSAGQPFVRLHCTIPTWCSSSGHCVDLHDLHDLRSRSLLLLHDLLNALRSAGIQANYQLVPSDTDLVVIRVISPAFEAPVVPSQNTVDILSKAHACGRDKALLAVTDEGPMVVIT